MKKPNIDLFALLISLYADQEGVEITYEPKGAHCETQEETH